MKKVLLALVMGLTGTAAMADIPDGNVYIRNIIYGGPGCPQGSVSQLVSPDKQSFTLLFDEYAAEIGPGIPRLKNRKSCQLAVDLSFPSGWSFSLATLDYRGFASLDSGVTGTQVASYYFQGQGYTGTFSTDIRGPYDDNYQVRDQIGLNAMVWSPCGATRALNIKTEVRLAARSSASKGVMTMDSVDGEVKQVYGLNWRRCN